MVNLNHLVKRPVPAKIELESKTFACQYKQIFCRHITNIFPHQLPPFRQKGITLVSANCSNITS